jgi:Arylsulfotransferase (ASST)
VLFFVWLGCGESSSGDTSSDPAVTSTQPPNAVALQVELTTPETVPLARWLHAEADRPVSLSVSWTADDHQVDAAFITEAVAHDQLLLGFRGGHTYELVVTATAADGAVGEARLTVETEAIPAYFPQGEVIAGVGERTPGQTLLPMHTYADKQYTDLILVFDEEGQIVYWLDTGDFLLDVREWQGGLLALVGSSVGRAVHYGWDGEVLGSWACAGPGDLPNAGDVTLNTAFAQHFHHDVTPYPSDPTRLVGLGRYPVDVADYPASYDDPVATVQRSVANDVFVIYDTVTGKVLDEILANDLLPRYRIGYGSLDTTIEGWADWAHANSVVHDGDDFVVSFRHQDVIAKIDPQGRAFRWILANHDNWPMEYDPFLLTPIGDLRWPWHTHAPRVAPDGPNGETVITVFDNGNFQSSPWTGVPPAGAPHSRVVQYSVDEAAMTVRQDWFFDSPSGGLLFSEAVGDADPLPSGNVLGVWGLLFDLPTGESNASAGLGDRAVRVVEIDPADPSQVQEVEQLYISVPRASNFSGWTGYRAERIPSLEGRVVE